EEYFFESPYIIAEPTP
ncbi:hypothetical protein, partial [Agrobacterium sp.]